MVSFKKDASHYQNDFIQKKYFGNKIVRTGSKVYKRSSNFGERWKGI